MTVSSEDDLARLKRIGRIVAETLELMGRAIEPGITERELDRIGRGYLEAAGARPAPEMVYGFPGATCISVNERIAHGIPGDRRIAPGDLVNIDVSAEKDGFFAPVFVSSPDCQPLNRGSSCSRYQSIMSIFGFRRALVNACVRYLACSL